MKVLTRYLLRAHLGPLFFAFIALTGVILVNTVAKAMANLAGKGLPLSVVAEFFVLSLPANVALTLPMAVLVAVLYTFSTFAAENEITALRASGVDLRRAVMPLLLLSALIAGGMVWFNDRVLPASNYRWRVLMTDLAQTRPLLLIQPQTINPIRFADGTTPYYLEAQQIDAETGSMRSVSIFDVSDSRVTRTIKADSGVMAFNAARTDLLLTLYDGNVWEVNFHEPENFQVVDFRSQIMRMAGVGDELQRTADSGYRTDRDMTVAMMQERIDSLRAERTRLLAPLVEAEATPAQEPTASDPTGEQGRPADVTVSDAPEIAQMDGAPPGHDGTAEWNRDALSAEGQAANGYGGALPAEGRGPDGYPRAPPADGLGADGYDGTPSAGGQSAGGHGDALSAEARAAEGYGDQTADGYDDPASVGVGVPDSYRADSLATIRRTDIPDAAYTETASSTVSAETRRYTLARVRNIEYQIREYQVEIQKKFSIAAATFVFVLIGVPIALRFPRGGVGMVIAVSLSVFGIYYVGLIGGEALGDRGLVPPALAMWLTNLIFGVLGLLGFLHLGREQGTSRGGGLGELALVHWIRERVSRKRTAR